MGSYLNTFLFSLAILASVFYGIYGASTPILTWMRREQAFFAKRFQQLYKLNWSPVAGAWVALVLVPGLALLGWVIVGHWIAPIVGLAVGLILPRSLIKYLVRARLNKLEDQIVDGTMTLASGVRAGLNLVQSFQLLARNSRGPIKQEMSQLLREYDYGLTLEQAMTNAGRRIGSPTYRLLFSALETHRVRGGDLGETLDRIADAIREIQRLEKKVETLTAQGRAAARMMGIMPFVILLVLYMIDPHGVDMLFDDPIGKTILLAVAIMNVLGFLWIRQIVDIDI